MSWSAWLVVALVAGGVGYLSLAGFVWANRQGVGSRPLIAMLLAVKVWSVCYALELSSTDVDVAMFWSALKYLGVVALPPALWSFVLAYTGRGRMSRRSVALLAVHPVVVMTLLAVPQTRGLIQDYSVTDQVLLAQTPRPGPLFWPHAAYVYVLMLGADLVLLSRLARIAPPYRRQGALLIAASLLPCVGNLLWNATFADEGMVDPTPFLFGITAVVLVWGFFRLRLLDLTPVARGIVIEQMADGVLVLDVYGRVVDVNAAAASIISYPRRVMIGRYVVDVVPGLAPVLEKQEVGSSVDTVEDEVLIYPMPEFDQVNEALTGFWGGLFTRPELELSELPQTGKGLTNGPLRVAALERPFSPAVHRQIDLRDNRVAADPSALPGPTGQDRSREHSGEQLVLGPPRDVAVSMTWVTDPVGRQIARLVVLRDVTERNRTEKKLRELLNEQTRLSETLRQSLRPASLPQLPGLRFAARSVPSARGEGVGGDFYDVHPAGSGESAFVLGDVSGKGVHAAVVTSMARYTVRTLSAQGWTPSEVLRQLNRALQTPDDLERFCTVVYGLVSDPGPDASGGNRLRVTLTLGGHPPPLLRRHHDGSVHAVGRPGTALGLLPHVEVHEVVVELAPGDVLLAYTDGVTEARAGDEQFGEKRLAEVLAAVPHAVGEDWPSAHWRREHPEYERDPWIDHAELTALPHPATQLADAVADAVLEAVRAFSPERDDVALLVLAVA
ncbi:SpoIIE family protein phosphatase [Kineosporia rhizophila]|uniref:histidine kinase N-terminal 7TM domain-containing protein n=1 Tax=Kineosporia rhizophila TaxID=84633 RepID=UPI001E2F625B|nr:histidine kinase N-terminal 7TM domain-containing protein [Kineosporia rhizophila]MCE0534047.1 SpoIIE family protein phosphatase [Kineosporia rhizophila]